MWSQDDNGTGLNWEDALTWIEQMNNQNYLGYENWRLPNAKELHSALKRRRRLRQRRRKKILNP